MQKYVADYHIIKYEKMSEKGMFPHQAPVVQILDSAIHWITQLVSLGSDLSGGQRYPSFKQLGPEV